MSPSLPPLVTALLDPAVYPHAVDRVELVETHISWVFLAGERVYKVKKPVDLGFLDFTTLARRRHFCRGGGPAQPPARARRLPGRDRASRGLAGRRASAAAAPRHRGRGRHAAAARRAHARDASSGGRGAARAARRDRRDGGALSCRGRDGRRDRRARRPRDDAPELGGELRPDGRARAGPPARRHARARARLRRRASRARGGALRRAGGRREEPRLSRRPAGPARVLRRARADLRLHRVQPPLPLRRRRRGDRLPRHGPRTARAPGPRHPLPQRLSRGDRRLRSGAAARLLPRLPGLGAGQGAELPGRGHPERAAEARALFALAARFAAPARRPRVSSSPRG